MFHKKKGGGSFWVYIVLVLVTVASATWATAKMKREGMERSRRVLTDATWRAAMQCYAIEGQYPPDLDYLETNYGLMYDKERFVVKYTLIGANLMPEIFVIGGQTE